MKGKQGFQPGNYRGQQVRPELLVRHQYLWFFKFAYGRRAKRKNIEITLTEDEFIELVTSNCHYCGKDWKTETRRVNKVSVNMLTIDRKDSKLGYHKSNCVSCCKQCNTIKMDMPYEQFISHIKTIIEHLQRSLDRQTII